MTIKEQIRKILESLGIADETTSCEEITKLESKNSKESASKSDSKKNAKTAKATKTPDDYVSCRYSDLLEEIKYYPNGDAPTEHNSLWTPSDMGKKCYWYCSDKPVAYTTIDGKLVKFQKHESEEVRLLKWDKKTDAQVELQNAFDRYKNSVAKKWAMERDWIPDYRYSLADNESEVGLCVQEALAEGVERSKITKMCFDRLDSIHKARKEYKKVPKEEVCNSAERFIYAMLFTKTTKTLHKLESLEGDLLPLPTANDLAQFSEEELNQFKKIKVVFDRARNRHELATMRCWLSAQCFALNMPTKTAIEFIYGDDAVGKKKYRRCEVAYSRQANQVFTWLLEEVEAMYDEGIADGLGKWLAVVERSKAITSANKMYGLIKKYGLMRIEENSPQEESIVTLIITNPFKVNEMLKEVLAEACKVHNYDFFAELDGTSESTFDEKVQEVATVGASDDMPF